jgi:hypothetical protein
MVYPDDRTVGGPDTTGAPYAHLVPTRWTAPVITDHDPFDDLVEVVTATVGNSQRVNCSGQWVNKRDSIDTRIIDEFQTGTGSIIDYPSDVGGYAAIDPGTACEDTDSDGIPDSWESARFGGLSKTSSGDYDSDGYTNIEEYFNGSNPVDGDTMPPAPPTGLTVR